MASLFKRLFQQEKIVLLLSFFIYFNKVSKEKSNKYSLVRARASTVKHLKVDSNEIL